MRTWIHRYVFIISSLLSCLTFAGERSFTRCEKRLMRPPACASYFNSSIFCQANGQSLPAAESAVNCYVYYMGMPKDYLAETCLGSYTYSTDPEANRNLCYW